MHLLDILLCLAILDSMELHSKIDLTGSDLVTPEQRQAIVVDVQANLDRSDFGEQAAYLLADLVTSINAF